jgi:quercetin dioxygenase-like cupin family protein
MKKTTLYALALLLVPWWGCQQNKTEKSEADSSSLPATPVADMILPPAKDTTLPSGRHNIYLVRGRDQKGLFVERSTFPKGYIAIPHVHDGDLYVTILSGSCYLAFGDTPDTTLNIKPYGPGSFVVIPADKAHYEWFTEPCTMQIEGVGPQNTYFIPQPGKENKQ